MNRFSLAWRMLWRDARAGELHLLLAALVIAVAALSAVGFFADRVNRSLQEEANQLLGADLLLTADHPWPSTFLAAATRLLSAQTQTFPSMVSTARAAQLAEIKAVSEGYPLRGSLRIRSSATAAEESVRRVPTAGTVWVDERLASALQVQVGDTLQVGERALRIDALLMLEPDRGVNFFSLAPRLLMALSDLDSTKLVQNGSRVAYRLLLAGDGAQVAAYQATMESQLGRGERIEDARNGRPELRQSLERAQKFLSLSALLSVVLAAVAIALATRRYVERHLDACAVMRCLGVQQGALLQLFVWQFVVLALIGIALGCVLGYLAHYALYVLLASLLAQSLPPPSWLPALQGMTVGLLLFGFAIPPLLQLRRVPTLRVLRRELGGATQGLLRAYVLCGLALAGLMLWIAGELKLGGYIVGGFALAVVLFAGCAALLLRILGAWRNPLRSFALRHAIANVVRHRRSSMIQSVALALGFMAIMLLTVTRGELLDAWRRATPPDAPNRFVINIQPDQAAAVAAQFASAGVNAELLPMVRGRLMRINGREVKATDYPDERAQRLVEREFNLSWREQLPSGNRIVAGEWFKAGSKDEGSVEDGLAKTLGLKLGDSLEWDIAGQSVLMNISSLRKLDWDSMRVNFFVLSPPGVLEAHPQSLITSVHLPDSQAGFVNTLVSRFPNLTVIDVGAILKQLRAVIDQVAQAVQFVFLFTLLAGVLVLYAALANGMDERRQTLAILRALGAQAKQLRTMLQFEFAIIGALAGLIASLGALAVGEVLATQVFHFDLPLAWWLPPLATLLGAILVPLAASLATRRLLRVSPLDALRESA